MKAIINFLKTGGMAAMMLLSLPAAAQAMDGDEAATEYGEWEYIGKATYSDKLMFEAEWTFPVETRTPLNGSRSEFQMRIQNWSSVDFGDVQYPGGELVITVRQLGASYLVFIDGADTSMKYTIQGTEYPVLFSDMYTRGMNLVKIWDGAKLSQETAESWYGSATFDPAAWKLELIPCYHLPLNVEATWNLVFPHKDGEGNEIYETLQFTELGAVDNVLADRGEAPAVSGVYTLDGRQVRDNNSTAGLPSGLYIVAGKKQYVR